MRQILAFSHCVEVSDNLDALREKRETQRVSGNCSELESDSVLPLFSLFVLIASFLRPWWVLLFCRFVSPSVYLTIHPSIHSSNFQSICQCNITLVILRRCLSHIASSLCFQRMASQQTSKQANKQISK